MAGWVREKDEDKEKDKREERQRMRKRSVGEKKTESEKCLKTLSLKLIQSKKKNPSNQPGGTLTESLGSSLH